MLKKHLFKGCLVAMLALVSHVASAEIVMVVHPSNADAIDAKIVKRIFLGKEKKFPGGASATPINQTADTGTRNAFDENVIGRSSAQVSAYW